MSMTTTYTNTNTNTNAPIAAVDDDCYGVRHERGSLRAVHHLGGGAEGEAGGGAQRAAAAPERRAKWGDRLGSAALRALKRARTSEKEETDDAVRAAAMRACSDGHLDVFFHLSRDLEVMRLAQLVEECLDDVREREQQRGWAPLVQHRKECLPEGILESAAMQPYLRLWAAADAAADAAAAVEAAAP
jgi:hypothetical protein